MTRVAPSLRTQRSVEPWPLENLHAVSRLLQPLANPVRLRLLGFLRKPHYLEEVASHLRMSRQAARRHVNQLLEAGWVTRSVREDAAIVEYVISLPALLKFQAEVGLLNTLLLEGLHGVEPGNLGTAMSVTNPEFPRRPGLCGSTRPAPADASGSPGLLPFRLER